MKEMTHYTPLNSPDEFELVDAKARVQGKRNTALIEDMMLVMQGYAFKYVTDEETANIKTVPANVMPYASVDAIGGRSVMWRQVVNNGTPNSLEGWKSTDFSIACDDHHIVATSTSQTKTARVGCTYSRRMLGHRYYVSARVSIPAGLPVRLSLYTYGADSAESITYAEAGTHMLDAIIKAVYDDETDRNAIASIYFDLSNVPVGTIVHIDHLYAIDLTEAFGAGNEPTIEVVRTMLGSDFDPYAKSSLLDMAAVTITSRDAGGERLSVLDAGKLMEAHFPGGMGSVGKVYDEIDLEQGVAICRTERVNLSSLAWEYYTPWSCWRVIPDIPLRMPANTQIPLNAITEEYTVVDASTLINGQAMATAASSITGHLFVRNGSATVRPSGWMRYERAEPLTRPLDGLDPYLKVSPGGTLTIGTEHSGMSFPVPTRQTYIVRLGGDEHEV